MKTTRAFSLSIFFLFLLMGLTSAASLPTNDPFRLEGGFTVDGVSATQDHSFSAYVNGELYKTLETGSDGTYVITVGGQTGDTVSVYVDGALQYSVAFEDYGTYFQNIAITSSSSGGSGGSGDSGSGGSGSGGSGGSGSSGGSSGGSSSGSSSSSTTVDTSKHTTEEDGFSTSIDNTESSGQNTSLDTLVAGANSSTQSSTQSQDQSGGLSAITGAVVGGLSQLGPAKSLFVVLGLVVVILGGAYYIKSRKNKKPETQAP